MTEIATVAHKSEVIQTHTGLGMVLSILAVTILLCQGFTCTIFLCVFPDTNVLSHWQNHMLVIFCQNPDLLGKCTARFKSVQAARLNTAPQI